MKVPNIVEKKKSKRSEESEVITGSPYKDKLALTIENQNKPKENKNKKSTSISLNNTAKSGVKRKAKIAQKTKKSMKFVNELPNNSDCECLICGEWWRNSLPGEKWVQCTKCRLHEMCCS